MSLGDSHKVISRPLRNKPASKGRVNGCVGAGCPPPIQKLPARRMRPAFGEGRPRMDRVTAMAVEIALNQESERAALEGELIALQQAWREAEEIAAIVDGVLTR